jgi:hypothetical protein
MRYLSRYYTIGQQEGRRFTLDLGLGNALKTGLFMVKPGAGWRTGAVLRKVGSFVSAYYPYLGPLGLG